MKILFECMDQWKDVEKYQFYINKLYLKLTRVDVGNVSKKGKNEGIITWSIFANWFLTKLCLCIPELKG